MIKKFMFLIFFLIHNSVSFITTPSAYQLRSFNNYNTKLLTHKNNNEFNNNKNSSKIYKINFDINDYDNDFENEINIIVNKILYNTILVITIYTSIFLILSIPK